MLDILFSAALLFVLALLALNDLKRLRLPDSLLCLFLLFSGCLKGWMAVLLSFHAIFTLLGISLGLKVVCAFLCKRESLGWGDVKFLAISGIWIPFSQIPPFVTWIGILGFGGGCVWKCWKQEEKFPLGVAISCVLLKWIWMAE